MCSWRECAAATALLAAVAAHAAPPTYDDIGRTATAKEIAAWDIDVRPDFKGLPKGAGSVAKGMQVWEAKCASCHGVFGESNEVFSPIVGGTTAKDIEAGRVASLADSSFPGRTTLMKLSSVSTLWDYINRAMPWAAPKSLSTEEVYAVTAYILNMGGIVPDNFTLSNRNIGEVQKRLPNRNGMTTDHALWPFGKRKPDVAATACMKNCASDATIVSSLPDHARNAHGNLAEQNRGVGPQRGMATEAPSSLPQAAVTPAAITLTQKHGCVACHGLEQRIVGPSFREIAKKQAGRDDAAVYLAGKIKSGGSGVWGSIPMPPQALGEADAKAIAQWLIEDAGK
ncbi:c-type cytochrome [Piscinibacter sp.]|uniref:c-type cytochrome n=1 Tax=Piscinibacter sp. TaxID=1903157 RepID=UPI002BB795FD|nr:c-type cytochrome [Albitalea sp.]HUG20976.1 c-type cytochrome [Albitalea sp.]